jgi:hypothetical protein
MRKFLITLTVIALIVSIVGTGVVVYFDVTTPIPEAEVVSGE